MTTKKPPHLSGVYDPALDEPELTPAETAAAIHRAAAAKRALRHYLELVQQIPEVAAVLMDDGAPELHTVAAADREDREVFGRIFAAQRQVMQSHGEVPLEHRLAFCQEFAPTPEFCYSRHLPHRIVWRR